MAINDKSCMKGGRTPVVCSGLAGSEIVAGIECTNAGTRLKDPSRVLSAMCLATIVYIDSKYIVVPIPQEPGYQHLECRKSLSLD